MTRIDHLKAPLFIAWQLTRDCDLCCLHCCTESAPGKRLADELSADECLRLAGNIIEHDVPYVMLCGGEPLIVPHFWSVAEALGAAGVQLKVETNGQKLDRSAAERLARLPVRSIQVSLDGATPEVYARQRPGGSLERAHAACRAVAAAGMPLEVTFAPTRLNIHQAESVLEQAQALGAFRFNTGRLMRIGTAARLWDKIAPSEAEYADFLAMLHDRAASLTGSGFELCFEPFSMEDGLSRSLQEPSATLQVLPNGWVKAAAALPFVCGDLRRQDLGEVWQSYRRFLRCDRFRDAAADAIRDESLHAGANEWSWVGT
jgi:MoaA/NifB/PqqE/SkfB family radical SAM enzyme